MAVLRQRHVEHSRDAADENALASLRARTTLSYLVRANIPYLVSQTAEPNRCNSAYDPQGSIKTSSEKRSSSETGYADCGTAGTSRLGRIHDGPLCERAGCVLHEAKPPAGGR